MSSLTVIFGIGILLVLAGVAAVTWQIVYTARNRHSAERLAQDLGWKLVYPPSPARPVWFGGTTGGRWAAIRVLPKIRSRDSLSSGIRVSLELRVVMDVGVPIPPGVSLRSRMGGHPDAPFEHRFEGVGLERVTAPAREAMLGFVRKTLRSGPQALLAQTAEQPRDLKLADRAAVGPTEVPAELFTQSRLLLAHDHPKPEISPDALNQILAELAVLAEAIERAFPRGPSS